MIDDRRLYQTLGERLRALREQHGGGRSRMTQAVLANHVDLERTSITNIEKGAQKVPLHVLFRICETLGVSVAEVLPTLQEVQATPQLLPDEDVDAVREQLKTDLPLVGQAIASLLNAQEQRNHHGTTHK